MTHSTTKIHHTMLLNNYDNLLIVLRSHSLNLSANHRIILDPSGEEEIGPTHCMPKLNNNN